MSCRHAAAETAGGFADGAIMVRGGSSSGDGRRAAVEARGRSVGGVAAAAALSRDTGTHTIDGMQGWISPCVAPSAASRRSS